MRVRHRPPGQGHGGRCHRHGGGPLQGSGRHHERLPGDENGGRRPTGGPLHHLHRLQGHHHPRALRPDEKQRPPLQRRTLRLRGGREVAAGERRGVLPPAGEHRGLQNARWAGAERSGGGAPGEPGRRQRPPGGDHGHVLLRPGPGGGVGGQAPGQPGGQALPGSR